MDGAAVEVIAMDGIDHGADYAFAADTFSGIAFGQYLGTHGFGTIPDYGEIAGDDARG
ncbi:Uncharacterised protein [Klebsiella pneumoniae]|nr:Uncharacterised protein [Klebsiella pneumoniae]